MIHGMGSYCPDEILNILGNISAIYNIIICHGKKYAIMRHFSGLLSLALSNQEVRIDKKKLVHPE